MRCPSDKTKETGLCGECRKGMEKENEIKEKNEIKMKPKGRRKAKITAMQKFEKSLEDNPEYREFINMFRSGEKITVKTM